MRRRAIWALMILGPTELSLGGGTGAHDGSSSARGCSGTTVHVRHAEGGGRVRHTFDNNIVLDARGGLAAVTITEALEPTTSPTLRESIGRTSLHGGGQLI